MKQKMEENCMNIALAMPTPHNIFTPLHKQYGDIKVHKLSEKHVLRLDDGGVQRLIQEIVGSMRK